ncbi:proline-rich protein 11 [Eublepharis macularius]|uniref:Proline-rich protein 11 n=1 Tax=Eublepharis macularius TaxID=481883 RepID=A0AA97KHA2_EUBMA|nr:proline-rich protein 11 [Eublepharis macularius]XP_054857004.1 proline-rich protein 11 [Eublepharis macularius]
MAKYKQRRRKLRASVTFGFKKPESILPPLCPSVLSPKPPVSPLNRSRPFCSWSLTLPDVTKVLRPLVTTVFCWYSWCRNSILWLSQFFQVIGNAVFRSHLYLEELNVLKERLQKLETEFSRLESVVQNRAVASLEKTSCPMSENVQHQLPAQERLGPVELSSSHSQALMPPAPPPPPPLPPPPVPRCLSKTDGVKKQEASLKTDMPVQITLKDLLNVKLKKTESYSKIEKKRSPLQKRRALITISDLQSISLKSKPPPNCAANSSSTPSRNCFDFKRHLRKVSIKRSPGGTPLINKENLETGTGLTPIMTQALRRKFQLAHPQSPSPSHLPRGSSFEEPS